MPHQNPFNDIVKVENVLTTGNDARRVNELLDLGWKLFRLGVAAGKMQDGTPCILYSLYLTADAQIQISGSSAGSSGNSEASSSGCAGSAGPSQPSE